MGSLSYGISELWKQGQEGWFKLLSKEEGRFYNIPIIDDDEGQAVSELRNKYKVGIFQWLNSVNRLTRELVALRVGTEPE